MPRDLATYIEAAMPRDVRIAQDGRHSLPIRLFFLATAWRYAL